MTDATLVVRQALVAMREMRAELDAFKSERSQPIAIVGMGCRFPGGANGPASFWDLLARGGDAVGPVPAARWAMGDDGGSDPMTRAVRWGAFLEDVAGFDASFFGISPREARSLDPQQRL